MYGSRTVPPLCNHLINLRTCCRNGDQLLVSYGQDEVGGVRVVTLSVEVISRP